MIWGGYFLLLTTPKFGVGLKSEKSFQCRLRRPLAALQNFPAADAAGFAGTNFLFRKVSWMGMEEVLTLISSFFGKTKSTRKR